MVNGHVHIGASEQRRAVGLGVGRVQLFERGADVGAGTVARHHEAVGEALIAIVGRLGVHIHGLGIVGGVRELVGIPVGGEIRQVDHAHIGAEALNLLRVPQWECVVVTIGK